jgi:hypothetical protein
MERYPRVFAAGVRYPVKVTFVSRGYVVRISWAISKGGPHKARSCNATFSRKKSGA